MERIVSCFTACKTLHHSSYIPQFAERFQRLHRTAATLSSHKSERRRKNTAAAKLAVLLRELSDDEAEDGNDELPSDSLEIVGSKPWLPEFQLYLATMDIIPDGMSLVKWWGVSYLSSPSDGSQR